MASSVASVKELLDGPFKVTLTDGRILVGRFSCFDKQRNVLLTETLEYQDTSEPLPSRSGRNLGIVLVPRKWIAACHAAENA